MGSIGRAIVDSLRTLVLSIFDVLLKGIEAVYNFFIELANYRLLGDDIIQGLYTRIGLILGLFMVFRITFSAIEYLINPDTMLDKTKVLGNIVKKVLIMIILLGSVHFLFDKAYEIQNLLLNGSNNIMSKIVLNKVSKNPSDEGKELSWTIFDSFYRFNESFCEQEEDVESEYKKYCGNNLFENMLETYVKDKDDMTIAYNYIEEGQEFTDSQDEEIYKYLVDFDWFYGIAGAVLILYILIIYIIQLGVRIIQLAYLEIIAPIPIMMYLTPKGDETLKKWGQQCLTTFLDAFLRIAILYFIILIIGAVSYTHLRAHETS